jgi:hypothetical protein
MANKNSDSQFQSQVLKKAVSDAYRTSYHVKGGVNPRVTGSPDVKKTVTVKK